MGAPINMLNKKFGRATVMREVAPSSQENRAYRYFECKCDCGTLFTTRGDSLRKGATSSCGCLQKERTSETQTTNGAQRYDADENVRLTYNNWIAMMHRCNLPSNVSYPYYGGRGVIVDKRWHDFSAFLADMGVRPSKEYQLDRIDNSGNYEPGNVRWATAAEQVNNTRANRNITYLDKTQTLMQWAKELQLPYRKLRYLFDKGWPPEKCFKTLMERVA